MLSEVVSSTAAALGIAGTWAGAPFPCDDATSLVVVCYSDKAGTIQVGQSADGVNFDRQDIIAYVAGSYPTIDVDITGKLAFVAYTNGAVAQGAFRLSVSKKKGSAGGGTATVDFSSFVGPTGVLLEQADTPVNITATNAAETNVLNLAVAATRYLVRSLRLKCADPGANTVTVRLYELVNDVQTEVDSFAITQAGANPFTGYYSLMDMFGLHHLAGDNLKVTVRASAGGPYAVTGQYSYAKNG